MYSTTTGTVIVDTSKSSGILLLPSTSASLLATAITILPSTTGASTLYITTTDPDIFETGESVKPFNISSQSHQFIAGSDYTWYELGGQAPPAFVTSSLSTQSITALSTTASELRAALQAQTESVTMSNSFTPLDIPGCILWLDPTDPKYVLQAYNTFISTNGTNLSFWLDKSPSRNDFSIVYYGIPYGNYPGYPPFIQFTGNAYMRTITKFPFPTSTFSLFTTALMPGGSAQGYFLGGDPDGSNSLALGFSNSSNPIMIAGDGVTAYGNPVLNLNSNSINDWHLWEVEAANGQIGTRLDGGPAYPSTATIKPFSGMTLNGAINTTDYTYAFNPYICDVVLYSTTLSTYDRQRLEGFLAARQSIPLSPFHPFASNPVPPSPVAPAEPFSPSSIQSCLAWFSADDLASLPDGGSVFSWQNRMDPQRPASTIIAPLYSATDKAVYFNGAFRPLFLDPNTLPQGDSTWEALVVARQSFNKNSVVVGWGHLNNDEQSAALLPSGTPRFYSWLQGDDITVPIPDSSFNSPNVFSHNHFSTGYNNYNRRTVAYNDTTFNYSLPATMYIAPSNAAIGTWYDIENYNPAYSMGGYIYDVLIFSTVLDVQTRQAIDTYFSKKYNIGSNFPTFSPAYSPPSTNISPLTSSTFRPSNLSSLSLWFDGKDPLGTGSTPSNTAEVPIWIDKSSQSNDATADSNSPAPFYGFPPTYNTALSSITFSQTSNAARGIVRNTFYRLSNYTLPYNNYAPYTIFVVGQAHASPTDNCVLFNGNPTGERWDLQVSPNSNSSDWQCFLNNAHENLVGGRPVLNTSFIHCVTFGGSFGQYVMDPCVSMYINGSLTSYNPARDFNSSGLSNFIGRRANDSNNPHQLDGDIQEIIMFTSSLTKAQRQQVEGYLSHKWNIQLPIGHPYLSALPPVQAPVQPSTFTPTDIPGLKTWLDASDPTSMTLVGSTITAWNDKSQASTVYYLPSDTNSTIQISSSVLFGNPAAAFNGNTFLFTSTFSCAIRPQTTFYVAKNFNNGNPWQGFITGSYSNLSDKTAFYFGTWYQENYTLNFNNGQVINIGNVDNQGFSATDFNIPHFSMMNAQEYQWYTNYSMASSSNTFQIAYGGTTQNYIPISTLVIGACYMTQDGTSPPTVVTYNGSNAGYGYGYNGQIGEVLIYNQELPAEQILKIEGYLAWKWGMEILLPPAHPYRYTSPSIVQRPPFTPAMYNPGLWLDASTITTLFQDPEGTSSITQGSRVGRWGSISNLGFSTIQDNGSDYQPIWRSNAFNNKPGVVFPPGQTNVKFPFLYARPETMSDLSGSQEMSLFMVATLTSTVQGAYAQVLTTHWFSNFFPLASDATDNYRYRHYLQAAVNTGPGWSNRMYVSLSAGAGTLTYNTMASADNQFQLYNFVTDANQNIQRFLVNGNLQLSLVNSNATKLGWCGSNMFTLGSIQQNYFAGTIHEVIAYPSHLHDADRMRVEGYLAWKWGFQSNLPATHPFYTHAP